MPSVAIGRSKEGVASLSGLASVPSSEADGSHACFLQATAKGFHRGGPSIKLVRSALLFVPGVSLRSTQRAVCGIGMCAYGCVQECRAADEGR